MMAWSHEDLMARIRQAREMQLDKHLVDANHASKKVRDARSLVAEGGYQTAIGYVPTLGFYVLRIYDDLPFLAWSER